MKKYIKSNAYDEELERCMDSWDLLRSKSVEDSDGFYNDYSLWYNTETGEYACMLGDTDIYHPCQDYLDLKTENYDEALEFYESME